MKLMTALVVFAVMNTTQMKIGFSAIVTGGFMKNAPLVRCQMHEKHPLIVYCSIYPFLLFYMEDLSYWKRYSLHYCIMLDKSLLIALSKLMHTKQYQHLMNKVLIQYNNILLLTFNPSNIEEFLGFVRVCNFRYREIYRCVTYIVAQLKVKYTYRKFLV